MTKRSKKVGLPPGSLVYIGDQDQNQVKLSLIKYNSQYFEEFNHISFDKCKELMDPQAVNWIHVHGIHNPEVLHSLGSQFDLHSLVLEDIMNTTQRSKLDDYTDYLFLVIRLLRFDAAKDKIRDGQVSLILKNQLLISFTENDSELFDIVKTRLKNNQTKIRSLSADYLCYTLIDTIVDKYFLLLEAVDKKLEGLETILLQSTNPEVMKTIHHVKRDVIQLRKSIWPMREVVNHFRRSENPIVNTETKIYLHDVYDHTIQAIDTIESFRDIISGMLDVYLSSISQKMNEIMKVLTVVATIFVPLTFIASLYGMNFEYMPELHYKWGYPITLCFMLVTAMFMLLYFHKKKWI